MKNLYVVYTSKEQWDENIKAFVSHAEVIESYEEAEQFCISKDITVSEIVVVSAGEEE